MGFGGLGLFLPLHDATQGNFHGKRSVRENDLYNIIIKTQFQALAAKRVKNKPIHYLHHIVFTTGSFHALLQIIMSSFPVSLIALPKQSFVAKQLQQQQRVITSILITASSHDCRDSDLNTLLLCYYFVAVLPSIYFMSYMTTKREHLIIMLLCSLLLVISLYALWFGGL